MFKLARLDRTLYETRMTCLLEATRTRMNELRNPEALRVPDCNVTPGEFEGQGVTVR